MKLETIKLIFPSINIELCLKGFLTAISSKGFVLNKNWSDFYGKENSLYIAIAYRAIKFTFWLIQQFLLKPITKLTIMKLSNFPHAIATAQQKLLNLGKDLTIVRNQLLLEENSIDQAIAFSSDFKDDSQRKTAKAQMLQESALYQSLTQNLADITDKYNRVDINLQLVKNNFTVAKLEARERIAKMETLVA